MDPKAPDKKERLLSALEKGLVMIHLDARRPGVLVPEDLRGECHLRLNLSYRFDPPDLSVGEWGVRCTLSFGGSRFGVAVPWPALFAINSHVSGEFWMYPDDIPEELLPLGGRTQASPAGAAGEGRPRAILREVVSDERECSEEPPQEPPEATPQEPSEEASEEAQKPRKRAHLRVVK